MIGILNKKILCHCYKITGGVNKFLIYYSVTLDACFIDSKLASLKIINIHLIHLNVDFS